jgi:hypothetical protein
MVVGMTRQGAKEFVVVFVIPGVYLGWIDAVVCKYLQRSLGFVG